MTIVSIPDIGIFNTMMDLQRHEMTKVYLIEKLSHYNITAIYRLSISQRLNAINEIIEASQSYIKKKINGHIEE